MQDDKPLTRDQRERAAFKLVMSDPEKYGPAYMAESQEFAEDVISRSVEQHNARRLFSKWFRRR